MVSESEDDVVVFDSLSVSIHPHPRMQFLILVRGICADEGLGGKGAFMSCLSYGPGIRISAH